MRTTPSLSLAPVTADPVPEAWTQRPSRLPVLLSLAAVYLVWGSTYYAIRVALGSFSPFLLAGCRFLAAGTLYYAALRLRAVPAPTGRQWGAAAATGFLLLTVGNGAVVYAQQWLASGLAAVVVATMPLWATVFAAGWGHRPGRAELAGLAVGFTGVVLLQAGHGLVARGTGAWVILLAPVSWALGSVWSRRLPLPGSGMTAAAQMLAGGSILLAAGLARGERLPTAPTGASLAALAYLVVFGSVVGLSAYAFLLRHTRPAVATSYAFANPLVALALGVGLGGERIDAPTALAAAVVLLGVVLLHRGRS